MYQTRIKKNTKQRHHENIFFCMNCKEVIEKIGKHEFIRHTWPRYGLEDRTCKTCS